MSEVLQCPYCALRFTTQSELDQHKALDHARVEEEEKAGPSVEANREEPPPEEHVEQTSQAPEKRGFLSRLFKRS